MFLNSLKFEPDGGGQQVVGAPGTRGDGHASRWCGGCGGCNGRGGGLCGGHGLKPTILRRVGHSRPPGAAYSSAVISMSVSIGPGPGPSPRRDEGPNVRPRGRSSGPTGPDGAGNLGGRVGGPAGADPAAEALHSIAADARVVRAEEALRQASAELRFHEALRRRWREARADDRDRKSVV